MQLKTAFWNQPRVCVKAMLVVMSEGVYVDGVSSDRVSSDRVSSLQRRGYSRIGEKKTRSTSRSRHLQNCTHEIYTKSDADEYTNKIYNSIILLENWTYWLTWLVCYSAPRNVSPMQLLHLNVRDTLKGSTYMSGNTLSMVLSTALLCFMLYVSTPKSIGHMEISMWHLKEIPSKYPINEHFFSLGKKTIVWWSQHRKFLRTKFDLWVRVSTCFSFIFSFSG